MQSMQGYIRILVVSFFCAVSQLSAQEKGVNWIVIDGDTIDNKTLDPVLVSAGMDEQGRKAYQRLKKRVKRVMPYAKMAAYKMRVMEDNLTQKKSRKERKRYIRECEESLKQMYMGQLKDLSIDDGKILMKLIHRETGKTTWEIMKNYRGGAEAFFWQAFGAVDTI
jgi:ABC-type transporter MlaC component